MQIYNRNMEAWLALAMLRPSVAEDDSGHLQMTMHSPNHGLVPDT